MPSVAHLYENKAISESCVETSAHHQPHLSHSDSSVLFYGHWGLLHFWYTCSRGPALAWGEAQQWPQGSINCMLFLCVSSVYMDLLCVHGCTFAEAGG